MVDLEQLAAEQLRLIEDAIVEIRKFGAYGRDAIDAAVHRELDKYTTFLREKTEWSDEHVELVAAEMVEWTVKLLEAKVQDAAEREFKRELVKHLQLAPKKGKPVNDG